jgi:ElaB/YqjD/DUF883 family membrane-anchored ribosome-binding protein
LATEKRRNKSKLESLVAESLESTNSAALSTEFQRSIARSSAASDHASSKLAGKTPPLVDGHGSALKRDKANGADDQLQALKFELEKLKQSVATIAATARGVASEKVDVTIDDVEEALKKNVFASVGIAALVGYFWGRTR